jgi:hypothetical protein
MITRPTVLILGAGSSVHCGYPLGGQLIANICRQHNRSEESQTGPFQPDDIKGFVQRLSRSGYYSIDAFLANVGEQLDLGKFLIARELKRLEDLDRLFPPNESGWYQYLFNQLLVEGKPDFEKNKLSIITFNYDRSLEAYLHTAIMNRFGMSSDQASMAMSHVPIIHVHGILGNYPSVPYAVAKSNDETLEASKGIRIIHEIKDRPDSFCSEAFETAHKMLVEAERIFFLGFGFHRENLERFRFFNPENCSGKEVETTDSNMLPMYRRSLRKQLSPFGIENALVHDRQISCNNFFGSVTPLE